MTEKASEGILGRRSFQLEKFKVDLDVIPLNFFIILLKN
jgi:hypothetical protein